MDYLWSPWRYQYIANINKSQQCVFCIESSLEEDIERLILFRGQHSFVILNLFPYTCGHLMVAPYQHLSNLCDCTTELCSEIMELAKRAKSALDATYHPDGFNLGMNLGKAAGAGVEDHLHFHVVPRWTGDANFISIVGESRVLPESLDTTYRKLKPFFAPAE